MIKIHRADGQGLRTRAGTSLMALTRRVSGWNTLESPGPRSWLRRALQGYLKWNRGLLLDPWLRYRPILDLLEKYPVSRPLRILDVGSGNAGLAYFIQKPVVGVDIEFSFGSLKHFQSPISPCRASVTNLPFRTRSFDVVVSMDLIEHLSASSRCAAITELFRVARELLIVGFPFGESSRRFDLEALTKEHSRGISLGWREEHVRNGIPGDEVHRCVVRAAETHNPRFGIKWFGHEGMAGLRLRWNLQFLIGKDSRLYGAAFVPLYLVHSRGWRNHSYRRVYIARPPQ